MRARIASSLLPLIIAVALPATAPAGTKELKCIASRAEPWPQGFVKMTLPGGDAKYIPAQRINRITAQDGSDWTNRVLDDRRSVEDGALEVCYAEQKSSLPSLRGRPLPEQDWFPVIQAGVLVQLNESDFLGEESRGLLAIDLGVMKNITQMTAVGGSAYLAGDPDRARVGAKLRLRRWLTRTVAIDAAPGVVLTGTEQEDYLTYSYPGVVGELSLSVGDWIALTGQVETIRVTPLTHFALSSSGYPRPHTPPSEETEISWYLGAKFGGEFSFPGLLLSAMILGALAEETAVRY